MKSRLPKEYMEKYRPNKFKQVPQMTLYDLNKQLIKQVSPMTEEDKQTFIKEIFNEFQKDTTYFMLLCKELSYFTVFHKNENNQDDFAKTIFDLLEEQGSFITAGWDNEQAKNGLEYWVKINTPMENNPFYKEIYCFYLFKYDQGIVEVK